MSTLAIGLGVICAVLMFHKTGHKISGFLLVIVGAGSAQLILSLFGALIPPGLSIFLLIAAGIAFWQQVHKGNKRHRIGTPLIALVLGALLATASGPIGSVFDQVQGGVTQTVSHVQSTNGG